MTTIAYRAGMMACDSCWAEDGCQTVSAGKITRLKSGGLLGEAGDADVRSLIKLLDRVKTKSQLPSRKKLAATGVDFAGILVLPNGDIFYVSVDAKNENTGIWPGGTRGFAATGSGGVYALGAMSAGATAIEAVEIATQWDINSRTPVIAEPLKAA